MHLSRMMSKFILVAALLCNAGCMYMSPRSADKIVVLKSQRVMQLLKDGRVVKEYRVALGRDPVGHKIREGDHKTPEGSYSIAAKNPASKFYKSLRISYPSKKDLMTAQKYGVRPGGDIVIHGLKPNLAWLKEAHAKEDWTRGCIAVSNEEIEEIFQMVSVGTPIEIKS